MNFVPSNYCDILQLQRIPDGFVVTGAIYTNVREALFQSVQQENITSFNEAVRVCFLLQDKLLFVSHNCIFAQLFSILKHF